MIAFSKYAEKFSDSQDDYVQHLTLKIDKRLRDQSSGRLQDLLQTVCEDQFFSAVVAKRPCILRFSPAEVQDRPKLVIAALSNYREFQKNVIQMKDNEKKLAKDFAKFYSSVASTCGSDPEVVRTALAKAGEYQYNTEIEDPIFSAVVDASKEPWKNPKILVQLINYRPVIFIGQSAEIQNKLAKEVLEENPFLFYFLSLLPFAYDCELAKIAVKNGLNTRRLPEQFPADEEMRSFSFYHKPLTMEDVRKKFQCYVRFATCFSPAQPQIFYTLSQQGSKFLTLLQNIAQKEGADLIELLQMAKQQMPAEQIELNSKIATTTNTLKSLCMSYTQFSF